MAEIGLTTMLDGNSSSAVGSDPPESDSDAQINYDLDQQIRLPVKRRSELHGDTTLNLKRMKRRSATFNTDGASGNARIQNIAGDANVHITQVAAGHESTARSIMYNWLSSLDVSQNYNAARRRHQPRTGSWFIDGKQFVDWKADSKAILCIYGDPGSGKTILCSSVIEDVKDMCKSQALSAYAYFFFDSRNADKGLLLYESLLRSLLSQISDRRYGMPDAVEEMYRAHRDGRDQPSLKSLEEALRKVIDEFNGHVYIIIDSLDECGDRTELLRWIKAIAGWNSTKVHLLLTSRPEPAITDELDVLTRVYPVRLQGSTVEHDIAVYLDERLSLVNRWGNAMCALIKSTLITRADGMFRWVALQIDDLQRCLTAGEVKEQLKRLPRDLEETYERILSRSPRRRDLSQMLHWLAFSQYALSLDEIAEVVSVDLDAEDCPRYDSDLKYEDAKTVLEVCSGLVTEIETDGASIVKLAHFSVKEYLLSENIRAGAAAFFGISASISHSVIARTCLAYLLIFNELDSIRTPLDTASRFPLHIYAAAHAAFHLQSDENEACPSLEKLLLNMFASTRSPALVNWIRICDPHWHPWDRVDLSLGQPVCKVAQPLYYAALCGQTKVVERLLQEGADPNQLGGTLNTALKVASSVNHHEVVQLLAKHGADVDAKIRGGHPYTETALQTAVFQGHAETVTVLLELGANVNILSESYGTPLIGAAAKGFSEIVRLLLEAGADIHLNGPNDNMGSQTTALHAAVLSSNIETLELLFKWGANANAHTGGCGPALQTAASWGVNVAVVKLLLEHGADVNFLGDLDGTALVEAALSVENVDVLALLLEWGADVNSQGVYRTALQAATEKGHLKNTKVLLEHGADVNHQGGQYGSALQSAAFGGSTEVIQMILEKGADINVQGGFFGTALQAAAQEGKLAAVVLLLERGANVNLLGRLGSALHGAALGGEVEVVKLLLESGANVNLLGRHGSALHEAADGGKVEVVKTLLECGANVNLQELAYGRTPLHLASHSGHKETAKILLEWGARVNVRTRSGTALHEARNSAQCDCSEVEQLLLAYGAVDRRPLEIWETRYKILKTPRKVRGEKRWNGWKYTIRVQASPRCVKN